MPMREIFENRPDGAENGPAVSSGSAAYRLTDDERGIEHIPSGRRWSLSGRRLDIYRALSMYRGHVLSREELLYIVYGSVRYFHPQNIHVQVKNLRRLIAPDVVEAVYNFGYFVRSADGQP